MERRTSGRMMYEKSAEPVILLRTLCCHAEEAEAVTKRSINSLRCHAEERCGGIKKNERQNYHGRQQGSHEAHEVHHQDSFRSPIVASSSWRAFLTYHTVH